VASGIGTDTGIAIQFGGFEDEDEEFERQAALSSPVKGSKRITNSVRFSNIFEHF
jgi:hypothetical protein